MKDINYIQIGKTRNTLSEKQWMIINSIDPGWDDGSPPITAGTTQWQNTDRWFKPSIDVSFNFKNKDDFAEASQLIIGDPFVVKVFNPFTNLWHIWQMKFTSASVALFVRSYQNNYVGAANFNFKAQSVHPYDTWSHMISSAENDGRF